MNDSSDEPPLLSRFRSWLLPSKTHGLTLAPSRAANNQDSTSVLTNLPNRGAHDITQPAEPAAAGEQVNNGTGRQHREAAGVAQARTPPQPPPAPPPLAEEGEGEKSSTMKSKEMASLTRRFLSDCKRIILCSWLNWLLIFVPIGIAVGVVERIQGEHSSIQPTVVFSINAVAIIPLASLLAFATESVATKMGDTMGALLNVTFGNAVELIVFIIALVANEIQIVQAALLGSILSNLLLILGMCFLFGGLRFREQLYNSAVSQMSACLLSLSVVSLLLPTAFHASFNNGDVADRVVLKVSRGTSVVLLFVYILYLLFQLKSHAYMYESTPQHLIDEESHPGVLAEMLNSSSSSDESSSTSDTDSDGSSGSHTTAKRIKRALRRRRRKSSVSSRDTTLVSSMRQVGSPSSNVVSNASFEAHSPPQVSPQPSQNFEAIASGDEADIDGRTHGKSPGISSRDFQDRGRTATTEGLDTVKKSRRKNKKWRKARKKAKTAETAQSSHEEGPLPVDKKEKGPKDPSPSSPHVSFVSEVQQMPEVGPKKPFHFRDLSLNALPRGLSPAIFLQQSPSGQTSLGGAVGLLGLPKASNSNIRRTTSMPEMGNNSHPSPTLAPVSAQPLPYLMPSNQQIQVADPKDSDGQPPLSRTSSVLLLLVVTALVAVCAEFLVHSIDYLVQETGVSQAFIGLIVLPIVGNAAEHVSAVTVASKNKMDLAIGIALGSSIQIAIFVTPLIVLLGWGLSRDMSLYFSLFETISLFASAFIVNYLMIDGRSNYLEGALLIAAYVIIALAAFFYPSCENLSEAGGVAQGACR